MVDLKDSDNEYLAMPPEQAVVVVSEMLDRHAGEIDRALALAIVLRDRLRSCEGEAADPTDIVLAQMLVEHLSDAPEHAAKQCLAALLEKYRTAEGGAA